MFPFHALLRALCTLDLVAACLAGGTQTSSEELFSSFPYYPLFPALAFGLFHSEPQTNMPQNNNPKFPQSILIHFDFHSPSLSVCLLLGFPAFFLFLPLSSRLPHFVPWFAFF